jgi:hypothetical protein
MSFGPLRVFTDTVASGASTSAGVNLVKAWAKVGIQVPTMSTAASFSIQNSADGGVTFYNAMKPQANTATSGFFPISVASGAGTAGAYVILDGVGLSYPRVVLTGVVDGGATFKYVCLD